MIKNINNCSNGAFSCHVLIPLTMCYKSSWKLDHMVACIIRVQFCRWEFVVGNYYCGCVPSWPPQHFLVSKKIIVLACFIKHEKLYKKKIIIITNESNFFLLCFGQIMEAYSMCRAFGKSVVYFCVKFF